jgi:hypothetical protein
MWSSLNQTWATVGNTWAGILFADAKPEVEIGVFNGFQLNNDVYGVLDSGVLDGDVDFTVIPQGVFGIGLSRGRDKDIGRTSAGSMSLSLRNEDRFFDPLSGEFAELTLPRLPIRVTYGGFGLFTGYVDDWNYSYSPDGRSEATVDATDYFSRFARQVNAGGSAVEEATGARLNRILDQTTLNYLGGRDIDAGNSTLAAGELGTDSALQYMLNIVEQSEQGLVFMAGDGTFTFRERLLSTASAVPRFSDNGDIPFASLEIEYGSEELVNQAIVTGPNGTAISEDLTSQVTYGITALQIDTELSSLAGQEGLADFMIQRYANPEYRFRSLTCNLRGMSDARIAEVLAIDIGDQVDVSFTPNRIPPSVSIRNRVIGVSHEIGIDSHFVTFNFEKLPFTFFVLNDAVFGKLDEADVVLGF